MRVPGRILQHACVALAAIALPFGAPRALQAAGVVQAAAVPQVDAGIQVSAAIERRVGPLFTEQPAQVVRVAPGDTIESLGATFHVGAATLRWANSVVGVSEPLVGARLLVPPGAGVLVRVTRTAAPSAVAATFGVDPRVILDYNTLRDDSPLPEGSYVQLPKAADPEGAMDNSLVVPAKAFVPEVPATQDARVADTFPYGQCTYYVATRRNVTWGGNAGQWFGAAHAAGRPVGHVPVVGSIAVMWGSWYGHVAYVEQVNPDGSFVVSEMNVKGVGVVDERLIPMSPLVIGFIY